MINNEEEVRSKILLDYLKDLGFDKSEISVEFGFTIRLGRTEKPIRGRSDILCRRNGQNLFIIEVKDSNHKITQNDIEQGISYARALLDNIAPFTIITSGNETKIFDTITKANLTGTKLSEQSEFWKNGCTLSMDEDLKIRYDALLSFISFSENNLKEFCQEQVNDRIRTISGDISNSRAKYIESLYSQRIELNENFQEFLQSSHPVFGLVGDAGVGKSCSMCALALASINSNFVLFYNGTFMKDSVTEIISNDLNLFFSAKSEREKVLSKLGELARFTKKTVIIFIDSIDEVISHDFSIELSDIAYSLSKEKNLKLCISCKSTVWNRFLNRNETNNHLYIELEKFHQKIPTLEAPGFLLKNFNEREYSEIILAYRNAFNFIGELKKDVEDKLKNGFLLRIFSEVYKNKNVPAELNEIELIEQYLMQTLSRSTNKIDRILRILGQIGKTVLKHNNSKYWFKEDEGIDINLILDELGSPIDSEIPQELFDRNILIKTGDKLSYRVSFYFSTIRDYIICFHSFRLDKIDEKSFYGNLEGFYENYIGQSAINFYVKNASTSQLQVLSRFKKDKLKSYLNLYNDYLNKHFLILKKEFIPKTDGDIGIIIPNDLVNQNGYAFFPLNLHANNEILYEEFDNDNHDKIFSLGATTIWGSNSSLLVKNQLEVVKKNIYEQLKDIIREGCLYEYDSNIILFEKVASILYQNYKKLNYKKELDDHFIPRFDQIYPIDLLEVRNKVYKFLITDYNKYRNFEAYKSIPIVDEEFDEKKQLPPINVSGDFPPFVELYKIINILIERGFKNIHSHYLPTPDISLKYIEDNYSWKSGFKRKEISSAQFSNEQTIKYIKTLFENVEIAYKQIVQSNFPQFEDKLTFLKNIPHEYFFYTVDLNNIKFGYYGYKKSSTRKFNLTFKVSTTKEDNFKNEDGIEVGRFFGFEKFIHINNPIKTVRYINSNSVDENCIIRNMTYEILMDDINEVLKDYDIKVFKSFHH